MSVYYYLFARDSKECICLGRKVDGEERAYEGPVLWIGVERFRLPAALLSLLLDRFRERHGDAGVFLLREDELYDSGEYLAADEVCIQVGGDEDGAPPLSKYLPELREHEIVSSIVRDEALKI